RLARKRASAKPSSQGAPLALVHPSAEARRHGVRTRTCNPHALVAERRRSFRVHPARPDRGRRGSRGHLASGREIAAGDTNRVLSRKGPCCPAKDTSGARETRAAQCRASPDAEGTPRRGRAFLLGRECCVFGASSRGATGSALFFTPPSSSARLA